MGTTFPKDIMDCMKGSILYILVYVKGTNGMELFRSLLFSEIEQTEWERSKKKYQPFKTTSRNSGLQNKAGKTKTRRTGKKAERYQH